MIGNTGAVCVVVVAGVRAFGFKLELGFESACPVKWSNANRMGEEEIVVSNTGGANVRMCMGVLGGETVVGGAVYAPAKCEVSTGAELGAGVDSVAEGKDDADRFEKSRVKEGRLLRRVINGGEAFEVVWDSCCRRGGKESIVNDFRFTKGVCV